MITKLYFDNFILSYPYKTAKSHNNSVNNNSVNNNSVNNTLEYNNP